MENPAKALFSLVSYSFVKASLDLRGIPQSCEFTIAFNPSGEYRQDKGEFLLKLECIVGYESSGENIQVVNVILEAVFKFKEAIAFENIPSYFYSNSMAIVFPYVRAFVGTLSLQANVRPIVLPTLNISALNEALKNKTTVVR